MTLYHLAQRYIGLKELSGDANHPLVQWWLSLCGMSLATPDATPWCSAFINGIAWELRLPRSKSAAARSWLAVGVPVALEAAVVGSDVVILQRGVGVQPGADVLDAPGHVTIFAGLEGDYIIGLGGNQDDGVSVARFKRTNVLGVRRLA